MNKEISRIPKCCTLSVDNFIYFQIEFSMFLNKISIADDGNWSSASTVEPINQQICVHVKYPSGEYIVHLSQASRHDNLRHCTNPINHKKNKTKNQFPSVHMNIIAFMNRQIC